jgi:hypothetical protein
MRKAEIANQLADWHGYQTYLEVGTPRTGHYYAMIDRERFKRTERLVYLMRRKSAKDGLPVEYRTESDDSTAAFEQIMRTGRKYDVVFVDPFHTYDCSRRDLAHAFDVLDDQGTMIVHDCSPAVRELAIPKHRPGELWCGVTYAAFIDFVGSRDDLEFYTVDSDYGCGIVRRRPGGNAASDNRIAPRKRLPLGWRLASLVDATRWRYFDAHRRELLRLRSVEQFLEQKGRLFESDEGAA